MKNDPFFAYSGRLVAGDSGPTFEVPKEAGDPQRRDPTPLCIVSVVEECLAVLIL